MPQMSAMPFAKGSEAIALLPRMANRHGLIAATTAADLALTPAGSAAELMTLIAKKLV
jgi:hypothetical protein